MRTEIQQKRVGFLDDELVFDASACQDSRNTTDYDLLHLAASHREERFFGPSSLINKWIIVWEAHVGET